MLLRSERHFPANQLLFVVWHANSCEWCGKAEILVHTGRGCLRMHGRRGRDEAREEKRAERVIRVQRRPLSRQVLTTSCYAVVDLQVQRLGLLLGSVMKRKQMDK